MGIDILEKEEIITYRENDLTLLNSIRSGEYMKGGKFVNDFYSMVESLNKRLENAANNSKLPEKPKFNEVENWLMGVYKKYL